MCTVIITDDVTACKEKVLYTLIYSVIYYSTHTEKCYLFVLYNKNSNGLLKDFVGMKKEKQVCWRDLTWIWRHHDLCVCPLIDYGQQPMKMPTEVTLLYEYIYSVSLHYLFFSCFVNSSQDNIFKVSVNGFLVNFDNLLWIKIKGVIKCKCFMTHQNVKSFTQLIST